MRRFIRFHTSLTLSVVKGELDKMEELSAIVQETHGAVKPSYDIYYECLAPDRISEVMVAMRQWGTAVECTGEEVADHRSGLP